MKRKLLYTAMVAAVMGTANPLSAQSGTPMYYYNHYENGQQVGEAEDRCTSSGVTTHWRWGYGTNDVLTIHYANCLNGQMVPID